MFGGRCERSHQILLENGYHVQEISSSSALVSSLTSSSLPKRGFGFVTPEQSNKLSRHGWLTLVDSTHKTNKWDWRLFTLYVRDDIGCWCAIVKRSQDSP